MSLAKYLKISYLFLYCINIQGDIMLNDDDKLTTPLPFPYDGKIYSIGELNDFVSGSIASGKQPIIIFGANWCPDCRIFSGTMNIPKFS